MPKLHTSTSQYSSFASINETTDTKMTNSSYSFSNQNISTNQRPIIGRTINKTVTNQDYASSSLQDHYQSMPYLTNNSLLMPANSEQNRHNQIKMLQQQQAQYEHQIQQQLLNNSYDMFFGSNRLNDFASLCTLTQSDKENSSFDQINYNSSAKPSVFFDSTESYLNKL
jgi:hypothetical protein